MIPNFQPEDRTAIQFGDTSARGYTLRKGITPALLPDPAITSREKPSLANALNLHPNAIALRTWQTAYTRLFLHKRIQ